MADTTPTSPPEDETPNQKQARLRREKRQAKIAATGDERLARIKQLNGGVAPPDEVLGGPAAPAAASNKNATVEDPDEVDISDHPYTPRTNASRSGMGTPSGGYAADSQDPLRQAMMQMQAQQARQQAQSGAGEEEDPMAKMMQQVMGLMGGDPNNPNAPPQDGDPLQMLGTMMGAMNGGKGQQAKQPSTGSAYIWRIVHAISALLIAGYIAFTSTFNGSLLSRSNDLTTLSSTSGVTSELFYLFATVEVVLQSTRYFLEKGQLQGSGWLATIANSGFVPPPYAQWIRTVGRYATIWGTVVSDAMVVVFVLGVMAWWRGMETA